MMHGSSMYALFAQEEYKIFSNSKNLTAERPLSIKAVFMHF